MSKLLFLLALTLLTVPAAVGANGKVRGAPSKSLLWENERWIWWGQNAAAVYLLWNQWLAPLFKASRGGHVSYTGFICLHPPKRFWSMIVLLLPRFFFFNHFELSVIYFINITWWNFRIQAGKVQTAKSVFISTFFMSSSPFKWIHVGTMCTNFQE